MSLLLEPIIIGEPVIINLENENYTDYKKYFNIPDVEGYIEINDTNDDDTNDSIINNDKKSPITITQGGKRNRKSKTIKKKSKKSKTIKKKNRKSKTIKKK